MASVTTSFLTSLLPSALSILIIGILWLLASLSAVIAAVISD